MAKYPRLAQDEFSPLCLKNHRHYLDLILKSSDGYSLRNFDARNLIDSWFAYWGGRFYLKSTGSVQWFNYKNLASPRLRNAVKSMHFISQDAWNVLTEKSPLQRLAKDHAVPIKVLRREIKGRRFSTTAQLEQFLATRYRLRVITSEEHIRLNRTNLKDDIPCDDSSEYARYNDPRISIPRSTAHQDWLQNQLVSAPPPLNGSP